ncbi:hypothetical protein D3C76_1454660 [compost metagenome]
MQGVEVAGKIGREAHQQERLLRVDGRLYFLRAVEDQHVGKGFGAGEALGQLHRMFAVIFVIDGDGGVGHLQGGRPREQQHLDQHRQNQNRPGLRFAQQGL